MNTADFTAQSAVQGYLPGEQLAAARESHGMTVAEIARQLKLSPWQVEALEAGDYARLPGSVFVRGFIRNYARLVKLDPSSLVASVEPQMPTAAPLSPTEEKHPVEIPFPGARRFNWYPYAIGGVVVVAALAAYEFYPKSSPEMPVPAAQVQPAPVQAAAESQPAKDENLVNAPAAAPTVAAAESANPPASAVPVTAKPADADRRDTKAEKSAAAAAGEQSVRMRFVREAWVEIRDRNGRKIFSQLNHPGTEQVVTGLPPLSLVVGNANGVQLTHNEQPVDLARYTKVDVARLTLE